MCADKLTCGIVCFIISFVAYVIVIGVGWAFSQQVQPGSSLVLGAAIVTTIPVIGVVGSVYARYKFGSTVEGCALWCIEITITFAGLFELIGAILFFVAGSTLKDENSKALAYGVTAGFFGLIAALSCFCTTIACCVPDNNREENCV